MTCDLCDALLPESYTPQVDQRGRPCLAVCVPCNDQMVRERARRLGIVDLVDEFERQLRKVLPEQIH